MSTGDIGLIILGICIVGVVICTYYNEKRLGKND